MILSAITHIRIVLPFSFLFQNLWQPMRPHQVHFFDFPEIFAFNSCFKFKELQNSFTSRIYSGVLIRVLKIHQEKYLVPAF